MREEGSPLDLNNFPEDLGERYREGKQVLDESSTASAETCDSNRQKKKKSSGKEGRGECGKAYECRFCSLKFLKSQALGGHMNRHRQERETETLNRARQLVSSNEGLSRQCPLSHLGCNPQAIPSGNFHQRSVMGDPSLSLRTIYTRLPSASSSSILSSPSQSYIYPTSRYPPCPSSYSSPVTDYLIGHVVPSGHESKNYSDSEANYTCMGAPVGQAFPAEGSRGRGGSYNEEQVRGGSINRFREDF